MAGPREVSVPDPVYQEQFSGKKSPGSNYTYNFLKGDYEWRKMPKLDTGNAKKVDKLWDYLFGAKKQAPKPYGPDPEETAKTQAELGQLRAFVRAYEKRYGANTLRGNGEQAALDRASQMINDPRFAKVLADAQALMEEDATRFRY